MILDTTFLIDLLCNEVAAVKKAEDLERQGVQLATTTINVFELWRGFNALKNPEKISNACEMLDQFKIYPLEAHCAKIAGKVAEALDRLGQEIDPEDAMIAGIALEKQEEILTRNTRHFSRIPRLPVHGY